MNHHRGYKSDHFTFFFLVTTAKVTTARYPRPHIITRPIAIMIKVKMSIAVRDASGGRLKIALTIMYSPLSASWRPSANKKMKTPAAGSQDHSDDVLSPRLRSFRLLRFSEYIFFSTLDQPEPNGTVYSINVDVTGIPASLWRQTCQVAIMDVISSPLRKSARVKAAEVA